MGSFVGFGPRLLLPRTDAAARLIGGLFSVSLSPYSRDEPRFKTCRVFPPPPSNQ